MSSFQSSLVVRTDLRFMDRPVPDEQLLTVLNVPTEYADYLRVVDSLESNSKDSLALVHYLSTYTDETKTTINTGPMEFVGHVRGTIVDTNTGRIVCRSFPWTSERLSDDIKDSEDSEDTEELDLENSTIYHACEGTVLRLFYHGDTWHLSTHRKINANDSFWSGPTFGSMFAELDHLDREKLDKNLCYIFLLSHPANRLVFRIPEPQLMLIGIYNSEAKNFLRPDEWDVLDGVRVPDRLVVSSPKEFRQALDQTPQRFDRSGAILIADMQNPRPVKVMSRSYHDLREARGNDPSLRTRYIQLRNTDDGVLLVEWFNDTEHQQIFSAAEQEFELLVRNIHSMYMDRYVNKNIQQLPKEEFVTLQRCHQWHVSDRSQNKVTRDKVKEMLGTTPNHCLLRMLNRQRQALRQAQRQGQSQGQGVPAQVVNA